MISRRELLAFIAANAALPSMIGCGPPPPEEWRPLAMRAALYFRPEDISAVRVLGARFLEDVGRAEEQLAPELAPTLALLESVDPGADPERYDQAITGDFVAREIRDVGGWTLAATEAHLCALLELYGIQAA